tara:strand:+ start:22 stop:1458 length:1437 start_codon:yes stop_codon:yes gene_type:complete
MVFPILGANTESAAYEIENSLRFNDADSPKLTKTFGSAGSSVRTFTISFWVKKCLNGKINDICGVTNGLQFVFRSGDDLRINFFTPGSDYSDFITNQLFRDPSAWYHIVLAVDTTQGTEANRKKLYVNGSQVTSFATQNFPTENRDLSWNSTAEHQVGYSAQSNNYSDIYLSDFNSVDGQALDPTYFGETNDNGVWIPKKYTGSYGTNGFFMEFKQTGTSANSSGMGADTSGNDHHFTPSNLAATDVTVDTPTNNFATVNSLTETQGVIDFSEGNTQIAGNTTTQGSARSSIQIPPSGKWYIESEFDAIGGSGSNAFAFVPENYTSHALNASGARGVAGSYSNAASSRVLQLINATSQIGSNINVSAGVIVQLAIDQDNGKAWVGKEDTYYNSSGGTDGNPANGSNPTFTFTAENFDVFFGVYKGGGGDGIQRQKVNFGNPAFSISSGNADANGYGNFEYAPPSGYYAICTKNLAEYG